MAKANNINQDVVLNAGKSTRFLVSELCELLDTYLNPSEVRDIYHAYLFSAEAHASARSMQLSTYRKALGKRVPDSHMVQPGHGSVL